MRIGYDVGPLATPLTGVGVTVAAFRRHVGVVDDVQLREYIVSFRGHVGGATRLPIPAAVAHRLWSHFGWPRFDGRFSSCDVVHGTNYVVPPARRPRLVSVYDCWFLRHPDEHPAMRAVAGTLRRAITSGAHVHACSQATANAVLEFFPAATVHVVGLGAPEVVSPPAACPLPDVDGRPFVAALGTIERRKNIPALVRAFGAVVSGHPDARLVIAGGDGDDRPAVEASIDALGSMADRVLLLGRVDDSVKSWLLHRATVLAYPSLDEGFGLPLLEAMQAGTPIVTTNAGSIPEVVGDAAIMVAVGDHDALAGAISSLLDDEQRCAELRRAGQQRWPLFRWEDAAMRLIDVYRTVATG
jgi:glycosyltransferase involved in cell wall biosynthesis